MTCQVIISDYVAERRMVYVLEATDFDEQKKRWHQEDDLLVAFKEHPFFTGCTHWHDLSVVQFHALIINILGICALHSDEAVATKHHPAICRLTFFLCSLIIHLQRQNGCTIELLRVNRVRPDDVVYDFSARLDVVFSPPKTPFRIVIDND